MYKETLHRKELGALSGVALVLGLIAGVVLLSSLLSMAAKSIGFGYLQYVLYVLFILLGVFLIRKRLTAYTYAVTDDELLFEKTVGGNVRAREMLSLKFVTRLEPLEQYKGEKKNRQKQTYLGKAGAYVLTYTKDGASETIMFHPSPKMVECIELRLSALSEQTGQ